MFNEELTLGNFVCPIPICQPETNLESLLKIFQHNDCDLIAISSEDKSLKTISSKALLAKLGQLWQSQGFTAVDYPRSLVDQESCFNPRIQDFKHLLKPANVYLSSARLSEFLQNSEKVGFSKDSTEYLIVDNLGQLKGKLDQAKILGYLASIVDSIPSQATSLIHRKNNFIRDFVDSISLPLKIESATGQTVYTNQCWRELITSSDQQDVLPNAAIANWWMGQKFPIVKENNTATVNELQVNSPSIRSYSKISPILPANIELTKSSAIFQTNSLPPYFADHCAASNVFFTDTPPNELSEPLLFSHLDIQIEKNQEWSQIKIPLALASNEANINADPDNLLYWLVFTTKNNDKFVAKLPTVENIGTPEKIFTELISTISHELKSPLTGIIGLSSLLKEQKLGELTQRQTLYTQLINNSGYKLMEIVNDLLELQGIVDSNVAVNIERFNLLALCRRVYEQTRQKMGASRKAESDLTLVDVPLKLEIEPELEIVTTNKRNLAAILSHLFLEIFQLVDFAIHTVVVEITQDCQEIVVKISNGNLFSSSSFFVSGSSKPSSGWNLTLAKYLVQGINGKIQSDVAQDNCQLTLIFPSNNSILLDPPSSKNAEPHKHLSKDTNSQPKNITILCLYPETDVLCSVQDTHNSLDFNLKNWAEKDWSNIGENPGNYQYRIIEADGLEQAHTLARIWKLDVIIIDGHQINEPQKYLKSLQQSTYLATLPLITLDTKTTEAANLVEGLSIYPCLLPHECRSIKDLMQVIRIATDLEK